MANPIRTSDLYQDDGALKKLIAELKEVSATYEELVKRIQKKAIALEASLNKVTVTNSAGREEIEKVAKEADKLANEYNELNASIAANNKQIEHLIQIQKRYAKQAKTSSDKTNDNAKAIKKLGKSSSGAKKGVTGLRGAFQALAKTPLVAVISLLAGGLISLFSAFKKTETGAKIMARVSGVLQGVLSGLIGIVDGFASAAIKAFEDPQQGIKDLWTAIKENIVKRFEGLINLFKAAGNGLKALWERDLPGLKKAAQEAGTAIVQMTLGLDEKQQEKFADKVRETTKTVIEQSKKFGDLAVQRRNVAKANRALVKSIEQLITKEELLKATAEDTTKSYKEQEEAAEAASKVLEERSQKEIKLAKNNLSLINQEIALRRKNGEDLEGLFDQQLSAYQALAAAEREFTLAVRDNERTRAELKQERLERDLDILIDGFDNQKMVNERLLKDDKLTFAERQKILEDTKRLADDSFRKQIETVQKFTGIRINANELIKESDAVLLNEKIRSLGVQGGIEGRLLEAVRERRLALQDLAEAEAEIIKAAERSLEMRKAAELKAFDEKQAFTKSEFDLLKKTEAEKTKFRIQAEILRLQKILELNAKFNTTLSEDQVNTLKNQIKKLQAEFESVEDEKKNKDLFDLLGIKLKKEQKQAIKSSFDFAKDQLAEFLKFRIQIAQQNVQQANDEVQAAQQALQIEIANRAAGEANLVETKKRELEIAKANQAKALKEQEKAQKAQLVIQTVQQASNLITAASKIWAQLKFPLAIPAIGVMFGSFAAAKVKAFQATKKQFSEGGYEIIGGGTHASGNDTFLGFESEGKPAFAERGEGHAIFKPGATRKYASILPQLVHAINNEALEAKFTKVTSAGKDIPLVVNSNTNVNTSKMEKKLDTLIRQGEGAKYYDNGRIKVYMGTTTYYVDK